MAGCGPQRVASALSNAAPVGVQSSVAGAPGAPAYDGAPRSSSATAGGGTGIVPWAPEMVPDPTATWETTTSLGCWARSQANPAHTPTTSAMASRAPTSWNETS